MARLPAELAESHVRETSIALTPLAEGRFETYLDGQKVYDRKQSKEEDFVATLWVFYKTVPQLAERLNEAVVARGLPARVALG